LPFAVIAIDFLYITFYIFLVIYDSKEKNGKNGKNGKIAVKSMLISLPFKNRYGKDGKKLVIRNLFFILIC
jgi:hypothetical protein